MSVRQTIGHWNEATVVPAWKSLGPFSAVSTVGGTSEYVDVGAAMFGCGMNDDSGRFSELECVRSIGRAGAVETAGRAAVLVAVATPADACAIGARSGAFAGGTTVFAGCAVSCRYALMKARFVVVILSLPRRD